MSGYLIRNFAVLVRDRQLRREFAAYLTSRLRHGVPLAGVPGGALVRTGSFSEFHSLHCLMPTADEFAMVERAAAEADGAPLMIDVGANVGAWALMMGKCAKSPRVVAFEPGARTFAVLRENVQRNGLPNVEARQAAVSDSAGTVRFQDSRTASVYNRLQPSSGSGGAKRTMEGCAEYDVPSVTLDDVARELQAETVDLLKVDVEGAEPLVLRGMARLLAEKRVRRIYIELEPDNLQAFGFGLEDVLGPLFEAGFRLRAGGLDDPSRRWINSWRPGEMVPSNGYFELAGVSVG